MLGDAVAAVETGPAIGQAVLLHVGPHGGGAATSFHWWYAAAGVAIVGGVGGLLYWYYGKREWNG